MLGLVTHRRRTRILLYRQPYQHQELRLKTDPAQSKINFQSFEPIPVLSLLSRSVHRSFGYIPMYLYHESN